MPPQLVLFSGAEGGGGGVVTAVPAATAAPHLADLGVVRAPADLGRVRFRVDFFFRTKKKNNWRDYIARSPNGLPLK